MATYTATVQLTNGTLAVTRPHPAPQAVDDAVDSLLYRLTDADQPTGPTITSIGVTLVTDDTGTTAPPPPLQDPLPGTGDGDHAAPDTTAITAQDPPTASGPLAP